MNVSEENKLELTSSSRKNIEIKVSYQIIRADLQRI